MPKLSWILIPLTALTWWHAYHIYLEANLPLLTTGRFDDQIAEPISESGGRSDDGTIIDDKPDRLFYFIQISDLHISAYRRQSMHHLRLFLNTTLPIIRPQFVLVTGDLTDAKDSWKVSSLQIRQEWVDYRSLLDEFGISKRTDFWWDQRGNHDCFNVPSWQSRQNYYRELSVVGDEQYAFQYTPSYGNYSFIALDACPVHGPSRPFNFFGYFDSNDMNFLERRLRHFPSNHTFLLSHYPISTTLMGYTTDGKSFDSLSQHISVFLSGHLHKLAGGLGNILHAQHPNDLLELELADLKQHGSYRVIAIDNDLISFVDGSVLAAERRKELERRLRNDFTISEAERRELLSATVGDDGDPEPLVLITNPKDSRYLNRRHEPTARIRRSTHIRFLVFSNREISRIELTIDGKKHVNDCKSAQKASGADMPLYVCRWDPAAAYDDKQTHQLTVRAWDDGGRRGEHSVRFRLDGDRQPLNIGFGEIVMTARYSLIFKCMFIISYLTIAIGLLLGPKLISAYLHKTHRYHRWRLSYSRQLIAMDSSHPIALPTGPDKRLDRWRTIWQLRLQLIARDFHFFIKASTFRLVTLASLPSTFYPLYLFTLYITIGPFFVGELVPSAAIGQTGSIRPVSDRFGAFYLYGMYIEHRWLPMMDTWLFGMLEVLYILGPLVVYLSFCITPPEQLYSRPPPAKEFETHTSQTHYYFPPVHDRRRYPLHRRPLVRLIVSGSVLFQLVNVFFIGLYYGPWAMVLSPGKTWFVLWTMWALWRHRWSEYGREVDLLVPEEPRGGGLRRHLRWNSASDVIQTIGRTVVDVAQSPVRLVRGRQKRT